MGNYNPPYEITDKIVMLVASIAEKSGRIMEYYKVGMSGTNRERRIRAIHASKDGRESAFGSGDQGDCRGSAGIGE